MTCKLSERQEMICFPITSMSFDRSNAAKQSQHWEEKAGLNACFSREIHFSFIYLTLI